MDPKLPLLYLVCTLGGIMLIGGIYLLRKRTLILDNEGKKVTKVSFPFGLTFQTHTPALAYFVLGVALVVWPMYRMQTISGPKCVIHGQVHANSHPVQIYAVIKWDSLTQDGPFSVTVPRLFEAGECYKILYVCRNLIAEDQADMQLASSSTLHLPAKQLDPDDVKDYEAKCDAIPTEFK
jgi:hypothetical protein